MGKPKWYSLPVNYNFNVYRGRRIFNLNFSARNDKQAIADATNLIPNFAKLRWVLWYCPNKGRKWRRSIENLAKSSPVH
jgi:hypothetical protein